MKLSLPVEADTINVMAHVKGQISVDIDGIELTDLINMVRDNGYSLRVVNDDDNPLPPVAQFNGIQCSIAHVTKADNSLLYTLSHQHEDHGDSDWICYTGSGYHEVFTCGH